MLTAQAEAEKIRFIGEAEAASIEAVGKAEAEKMRLKAEAYQQYGDAAKTALVLEALPKVCTTYICCSWFLTIYTPHSPMCYIVITELTIKYVTSAGP